ncbi:MAG: hypothetical protein N3E45_14065 [Oscillatoriaceae bacterium SKW80]|nr:hypothetical protein [Oscillatoriaceae bacterium SKYG93]MCX8121925.1 hypothetical protein [Oscillatoriaceae bacterium SKW80]MDW8451883.1 hypothetical protein [Oscillatoriaceae cyanobacterium SKYGB_i_bin93]HIK28610.1 hypothetical protein [Oscillatoriaceae cyanobacterium M7585_C2015_266]
MLTLVIVINGVIALLCLYVAWQLRRLRRAIAKAANTLIAIERGTYRVLYKAPTLISKGQIGTRKLRQQYQKLQAQLWQLEQLLALWRKGRLIWLWGFNRVRRLRN